MLVSQLREAILNVPDDHKVLIALSEGKSAPEKAAPDEYETVDLLDVKFGQLTETVPEQDYEVSMRPNATESNAAVFIIDNGE